MSKVREILPWTLGVVAAASGIAFAIHQQSNRDKTAIASQMGEQAVAPRAVFPDLTTEPASIAPITAEEAKSRNDDLPFSALEIQPALPIDLRRLGFAETEIERSLQCLTDAVYYEAGFQTAKEQRAVAQVVLNRVRHPAFPASVCEVVYEGSTRSTGCQFTFTCDGSMRRRPAVAAYRKARSNATAMLSGSVEPSVGMATHYHADYVFPYWGPRLTKIVKLGPHIFYRWNGAWGRRSAFTSRPGAGAIASTIEDAASVQAYTPDNTENVEAISREPDEASAILADTASGTLLEGSATLPRPQASDKNSPRLRADETDSILRADQGGD